MDTCCPPASSPALANLAGRWHFAWSVRFPGATSGLRNVYLNVPPVRYGSSAIGASTNAPTIMPAPRW